MVSAGATYVFMAQMAFRLAKTQPLGAMVCATQNGTFHYDFAKLAEDGVGSRSSLTDGRSEDLHQFRVTPDETNLFFLDDVRNFAVQKRRDGDGSGIRSMRVCDTNGGLDRNTQRGAFHYSMHHFQKEGAPDAPAIMTGRNVGKASISHALDGDAGDGFNLFLLDDMRNFAM